MKRLKISPERLCLKLLYYLGLIHFSPDPLLPSRIAGSPHALSLRRGYLTFNHLALFLGFIFGVAPVNMYTLINLFCFSLVKLAFVIGIPALTLYSGQKREHPFPGPCVVHWAMPRPGLQAGV